jgi:hypothetical protein
VAVPNGAAVSATATDQNGNTTGFAAAVTAGSATLVPQAQEHFVQALYLDELGRPGTTAELDGWVAALNGLGGPQGVVAGIEGSFEARDHLVKGWYQTFLGRAAAGGEELGWVSLLADHTEEQVLSQILGTPEFFNHAQQLVSSGTPQERSVQALYLLLLNRTGSMAEVDGWVSALPQRGQAGVALGILQSLEYRTDVISGYYTSLLHRPADGELSGWASSGLDLATVRMGFETTPEFFLNG